MLSTRLQVSPKGEVEGERGGGEKGAVDGAGGQGSEEKDDVACFRACEALPAIPSATLALNPQLLPLTAPQLISLPTAGRRAKRADQ